MPPDDIDLLNIDRGLVVAPAGCGKTQLLVDALGRNDSEKPILVLTHTNAGVAALRYRLNSANVRKSAYRLATIDGWAIRLISTFPLRSGHDPDIIEGQRPNYPKIRTAAFNLLKSTHINDVISASYSRIFVDEYQDCSIRQHAIIYYASACLPVCIVGDPVQAIFGFGDDQLAEWDKHVCSHFPLVGELEQPWRWINAESEELGSWLLEVRKSLLEGKPIDLLNSPNAVNFVQLNGNNQDYELQLAAGRTNAQADGSVLIIGESTSPTNQQKFASQTPGAVTVEAVDLRDLVSFASDLDITAGNALEKIADFSQKVMTNVGAQHMLQRVDSLTRGTARNQPTDAEQAALTFNQERTYRNVSNLLVEINKQGGVRVYRPAVLSACYKALQMCITTDEMSFHEAAVHVREQNRLQGRKLPKRAVGSTLLLKGLESEVCVILDADSLNARNLYVAMTRGSNNLTICSRNSVLNPEW